MRLTGGSTSLVAPPCGPSGFLCSSRRAGGVRPRGASAASVALRSLGAPSFGGSCRLSLPRLLPTWCVVLRAGYVRARVTSVGDAFRRVVAAFPAAGLPVGGRSLVSNLGFGAPLGPPLLGTSPLAWFRGRLRPSPLLADAGQHAAIYVGVSLLVVALFKIVVRNSNCVPHQMGFTSGRWLQAASPVACPPWHVRS